jgi:hypothetical protein
VATRDGGHPYLRHKIINRECIGGKRGERAKKNLLYNKLNVAQNHKEEIR